MQVCLVYFDGLEEPQALRDRLASLESHEMSIHTWLVPTEQNVPILFLDLKKHIGEHQGLVVVPLEQRLTPLMGHAPTAGSEALHRWLEEKRNRLNA